MNEHRLTQELLRELLDYDPATGEVRWRVKLGRRAAGDLAGYTDKRGYRRIYIGAKQYRLHRVIWCYVTGRFPDQQIDHINCDPGDNRFCNLREALAFQNAANQKRFENPNCGATIPKGKRRWVAKIWVNRKNHYLGSYLTREEAAAAYRQAAIKLRGEFART